MFKKQVKNQYLGVLSSQGQSKVWQARQALPSFDGEFAFQIWGDKDGLTSEQEQAVAQLFTQNATIKNHATLAVVDFLSDIDFLLPFLPQALPANPAIIWQYLHPDYSEIRDFGEIALGFSQTLIQDVDDHLLYVVVKNGEFIEVNSE